MAEKICRLCLKTIKTQRQIVLVQDKYGGQTYAALFEQTSGFCIEDDEPQILCHDCCSELVLCFKFIQKCNKAQEHLKPEMVKLQPEMVKVEDNILVEDNDTLSNEMVFAQSIIKTEKDDFESEPVELVTIGPTPTEQDSLWEPIEVENLKPENSDFDDQNSNFNDDNNDSEAEEPSQDNESQKPNQVDIACEFCINDPKHFRNQRALNAHQNKVHKINNQCPFCKRTKMSLSIIKAHIAICSLNPENRKYIETTYRCERCGEKSIVYSSHYQYADHLRMFHHLEKTASCQYCLHYFYPELIHEHEPYCRKNPTRISREVRRHEKKVLVSCTCGITLQKKHLKQHIKMLHEEGKKKHREKTSVFCDLCPGKSFTKTTLIRHMKVVHLKGQQLKNVLCSICGETFDSNDKLGNHQREKHTELYPLLSCPQCPYKTASAKILSSHKFKHNKADYKKHLCNECNSKFTTKKKLDMHMTLHSKQRKFACEICGLRYKYKTDLRCHIRQVHLEKYIYECPVCKKHLKSISGARRHVKRYHPDYQLKPGVILRRNRLDVVPLALNERTDCY